MQQNIGVIVLLERHDGETDQVLLGVRKNSYKAGLYGLPGGRVEPLENLADAAKRELLEETGATAENMRYLGVIKDAQMERSFDFIHFVYACDKWSGEPRTLEPEKCEGWQWFDSSSLPSNTLPAHVAAASLLQGCSGGSSGETNQSLIEIVS